MSENLEAKGVHLTCVKCGYETVGGSQVCPKGCTYGKKKPVLLRTDYALRKFKLRSENMNPKLKLTPEQWLLQQDKEFAELVNSAHEDEVNQA